jgi:hypothetical protein
LRISLPEPRSHNNIGYGFILGFIEPFYFDAELRLRRMTLIISGRQVKEAEEDDDISLVYGKFRFQQVGKC